MDAREKLRQYLEQRREMGESELVLDKMTVDDALRIVGARGTATASAGSASAPVAKELPARNETAPRSDDALPANADWRAALRETGAAPNQVQMPKPSSSKPTPASPTPTPLPSTPPLVVAPMAPAAASGPVAPPIQIADVPAGLVVGTPAGEPFGGSMAQLDSLEAVAAHIASCTRCPLYSTAINHVPGEGNPNADLMCVGEAPGATEDELGRPFVGASGQLLTKILAAVGLAREDVFIANVLKHRPPGNRNPRPEEVTACSPYLIRQIELIRPKVIIAWGTFAAQTLLDTKLSIGKLRGQIHRYYGVPLIVTYHPAALLRNPSWKRPTWEDVQLARRILDSAGPGA
jgi:uracil-DNA glycosylase